MAIPLIARPIAAGLLLASLTASAAGPSPAPGRPAGPSPDSAPATPARARQEIVHPPTGHEARLAPPALVVDRHGPLVAWTTSEGHDNVVYTGRPGGTPVRVSPSGQSADSLHQSPGLTVGPAGEIYVTWAARRAAPDGGLFASDLQLARSLDGGASFDPPLRLHDDTPTSHSFEGLAVAPDGTVLVAWIETRPGARPRTFLARVGDRGRRVDGVAVLDDDETCVCCRISVAAAPPNTVGVLWRKVFPGDIRDMVLARSIDGGRTVPPARRVHEDRWRISACPHRGGSVAFDARGRAHAVWYTEGTRNVPDVLYAVAAEGTQFGAPQRVHTSSTSIPDHARLAVRPDGRAVIVWEDATAVRRRVLVREASGARLGATRVLSDAVKGYAPDVAIGPDGIPVVAWHEERFPRTITMVMRLDAAAPGGRTR
jgi:hypothetical protein